MKSMLKLFCIALISTGLVLSGCEKQEAADEEATAEETEQPVEEEAAADEEAEAEAEADTGTEQEADTGAAQADTGAEAEQGAAANEQQQEEQAAKPKPATPPFTGSLSGNVGGSGISQGLLKLTIEDDYTAKGSFRGKREDAAFVIPLTGTINKKSNAISLTGERGNNQARLTGEVGRSGVAGKLQGTIHDKPFNSRFSISQ